MAPRGQNISNFLVGHQCVFKIGLKIEIFDFFSHFLLYLQIIKDVNDDEARSKEERQMLEDVNIFLKSNENQSILSIHPKTGATSLHVAASKGYLKVLEQLLISNRLDIDQQDFDGWTALHAASYWGNF